MDLAILEPTRHGTEQKNIAFYDHPDPKNTSMTGHFPAHWHKEYEIIYVTEGPVVFQLNGKEQAVNTGEALIVNRNVIHSCTPPQRRFHYICVVFGEQYLFPGTADPLYEEYFLPLHAGRKSFPAYISGGGWQEEMLECIRELCRSGLKKERGCELEWRMLLLKVVHIAYRNNIFEKQREPQGSGIAAVRAALLTIQDNYAEPIRISDLAERSGFSVEHFCRIFKRIVGKTPTEYLLAQRIRAAEYRLTRTTESISEIASESGFDDINYFSRCFKKVHAMTPSQYRKDFS